MKGYGAPAATDPPMLIPSSKSYVYLLQQTSRDVVLQQTSRDIVFQPWSCITVAEEILCGKRVLQAVVLVPPSYSLWFSTFCQHSIQFIS